MKKLTLLTLMVGQFALSSTIQVAKTLPGKYRSLDNGMKYNFEGRYYIPGAGHFYADHGMVIDPQAFTEGSQHQLSDYVSLLPQYIVYKMLKNYELLSKGADIKADDNIAITESPYYPKLKKHFKHFDDEINVGDIYVGPYRKVRGEYISERTCKIGYGTVLEVREVYEKKSLVKVGRTFFSKHDIKDLSLCKSNTSILVENDELIDFNKEYVEEAYKRNYSHQKKMKAFFSNEKYVSINADKTQFCSGSKSGYYSEVMDKFINRIGDNNAENIYTKGSMDNLLNVKRGVCDYGLVQSDLMKVYPDFYRDELGVDVVEDNLYEEKAHLVCNKSLNINNLNDFQASHTISIGSTTSGTNFTYRAIQRKIQSVEGAHRNFLKVRLAELDDAEALKEVKSGRRVVDCLFTMAGKNSSFLKEIKASHKNVNLVDLNFQEGLMDGNYTSSTITNPVLNNVRNLNLVRTVATQVVLIKAKPSSHKKGIKSNQRDYFDDIKDVIEEVQRGER